MTSDEVVKPFWWGTQYYRPPTPLPTEWEADFHRLKGFGLNLIQVRVFWRCHERTEGNFQWDDLDRFMNLAGAHNLQVVQQITLETAPQYIFDKYDGFRVDIRGQRIWPISHSAFYPGGWIPCFDNPVVMGRGIEFIKRLVERYRGHAAMGFWHAWNEPRSRPMGECACGHSILNYRQWLSERFGTIEKYNDHYGRFCPDFASIDAARDTADFAEMHLWRQWAASRVCDRVGRVVKAVRSLDSHHAVISHVGMNNMQQDPLMDISDDVQTAPIADLYGSSFEFRYSPEPLNHSLPFLVCDWMRHVGRGKYSIFEIYPSGGRFEIEVPAHQVQQWLWTPPACGATGEFLWQFKKERVGSETNDAGLVETDGSDNPTSVDARQTFGTFTKLREQFADWHIPQSRIGIVYDLQSDLVNRIAYTTHRDGDPSGRYELRWKFLDAHLYKAHFQGTYHLFWLNNIPVDVLSSQRLEEIVGAYDTLYLPAFYIVDPQRAAQLLKFVTNGGRLIVDAGFASRDANTWLHPVRPAFAGGYRDKDVLMDRSLREGLVHGGLELPIAVHRASFDAGDARVLSRWADGQPAAIEQTIGNGKILALGFLPGLSCLVTEKTAPWRAFTEWMRTWCGVEETVAEMSGVAHDITLRELRDHRNAKVTIAFRRWGADSATPQKRWQAWGAGAGETLIFEQSHVKGRINK